MEYALAVPAQTGRVKSSSAPIVEYRYSVPHPPADPLSKYQQISRFQRLGIFYQVIEVSG
jgi:hypothetical protein